MTALWGPVHTPCTCKKDRFGQNGGGQTRPLSYGSCGAGPRGRLTEADRSESCPAVLRRRYHRTRCCSIRVIMAKSCDRDASDPRSITPNVLARPRFVLVRKGKFLLARLGLGAP